MTFALREQHAPAEQPPRQTPHSTNTPGTSRSITASACSAVKRTSTSGAIDSGIDCLSTLRRRGDSSCRAPTEKRPTARSGRVDRQPPRAIHRRHDDPLVPDHLLELHHARERKTLRTVRAIGKRASECFVHVWRRIRVRRRGGLRSRAQPPQGRVRTRARFSESPRGARPRARNRDRRTEPCRSGRSRCSPGPP